MKNLLFSGAIIAMTFLAGCNKSSTTISGPNSDDSLANKDSLDLTFAGTAGDDKIDFYTNNLLKKYGAVSYGGASFYDGITLDITAKGLRRRSKTTDSVTIAEQWHIGSLTKSFTALLTGIYVEKGVISWDYTIGEAFPELIPTMNSAYQKISVEQLLTNTGRVTTDLGGISGMNDYFTSKDSIVDQRYSLVKKIVALPPETKAGEYGYSNAGFIIVGAMLEKKLNKSWETLIETEIYAPLGIKFTTFVVPSGGMWGHITDGKVWEEYDPASVYSENPRVVGPAGTICMTMQGMGKYLQEHYNGHYGKGILASEAIYKKLHTGVVVPDSDEPTVKYAMGWDVEGDVLSHNGVTVGYSAFAAINLKNGYSTVAFTNCGEYQPTYEGVLKLTEGLYKRAAQ